MVVKKHSLRNTSKNKDLERFISEREQLRGNYPLTTCNTRLNRKEMTL
jgi:hypothetical protein